VDSNDNSLLDQLSVVQDQPLEQQADGYRRIYEQLLEQLQSSDT
jgi:hypothetical protein